MNRRWVCNDVLMDLFPFFGRLQLGLKLALLSPRFNALVDKHFDGKNEFTIWRWIGFRKNNGTAASELSVLIDYANSVQFPWLDLPLPHKIRFKHLQIDYIDHSVIAFLRSNQQIFDKGTNLRLWVSSSQTTDDQPIWEVFVREIWPIFSTNIRHLGFIGDEQLDNLSRLISPAILTDLHQLNSINSGDLLPDVIGDFDGPNATAGQILAKWLHTPRKDGQPKQLRCRDQTSGTVAWVNNFKEGLLRSTTSADYKIQFIVAPPSMSMVPCELTNGRTNEKLTMTKSSENAWASQWIIKRCQIGETAAVQWEDENWNDLSTVQFMIFGNNCIGPLSPPEEAGQSSEKGTSSDK